MVQKCKKILSLLIIASIFPTNLSTFHKIKDLFRFHFVTSISFQICPRINFPRRSSQCVGFERRRDVIGVGPKSPLRYIEQKSPERIIKKGIVRKSLP